jgi:hypothetical protein
MSAAHPRGCPEDAADGVDRHPAFRCAIAGGGEWSLDRLRKPASTSAVSPTRPEPAGAPATQRCVDISEALLAARSTLFERCQKLEKRPRSRAREDRRARLLMTTPWVDTMVSFYLRLGNRRSPPFPVLEGSVERKLFAERINRIKDKFTKR